MDVITHWRLNMPQYKFIIVYHIIIILLVIDSFSYYNCYYDNIQYQYTESIPAVTYYLY